MYHTILQKICTNISCPSKHLVNIYIYIIVLYNTYIYKNIRFIIFLFKLNGIKIVVECETVSTALRVFWNSLN